MYYRNFRFLYRWQDCFRVYISNISTLLYDLVSAIDSKFFVYFSVYLIISFFDWHKVFPFQQQHCPSTFITEKKWSAGDAIGMEVLFVVWFEVIYLEFSMWGSMATTLQLYSECHGLYITASNHEHLNMSPVVLKIDTYFLFVFQFSVYNYY